MGKDSPFLRSSGSLLLQCEQANLHRALMACGRFSQLDPLCGWVMLTAQVSIPGGAGQLRIEVWSEHAGAGVWADIPACVARCGRLALPFQPLTTLVAQLRPGIVQLWQGQVTAHNALAPFRIEGAIWFTGDPVLVLEQESQSALGRRRTQRTRLRALALQAPGSQAEWGARWEHAQVLARVSVKHWQQALAPCLLLTRERAQPSDTTPEMNHELVLVHFASDRWNLLASTRHRVVQCPLPFLEAQAPAPLTHAGFPGPVLAWIGRSLQDAREPGPLTLSIQVDQEGGQVELLVQASNTTLACRGTQQALPRVWEKPLHWPSLVEIVVARPALKQALTFLASAKRHADWDGHVLAHIKDGILIVQWVTPDTNQIVGQREVPLLAPAPDVAPVLVNLLHWRQMLAQVSAETVSLQFGALQAGDPLGFVRLISPGETPIFLMTLSTRTSASSPPSEVAKKGEAIVASV